MGGGDICKIKWSFTRCFGGQVHEVLCLCSKETRTRSATFLAMDRVLFISMLEPYHAGGMFREKIFMICMDFLLILQGASWH